MHSILLYLPGALLMLAHLHFGPAALVSGAALSCIAFTLTLFIGDPQSRRAQSIACGLITSFVLSILLLAFHVITR